MGSLERTFALQRAVLAATAAGAAIVFWRGTFDVFNTVKFTWVALGTVAIATIGLVRASRARRVALPHTALWWAVGAFVLFLVVATLTSETPMRSFIGDPGRHTATAAYLIYVALLLFSTRLHLRRPAHVLAGSLTVASVPVAVYALAQAVDIGPFDWQAVEGGPQIVSTFGNADFLAAWLGITVPLSLWVALRRRTPAWQRGGASAAAALAFVASLATGSLQGAVIAPIGSALVLATWAWTSASATVARVRRPVAAGVGALVAIIAILVLTGAGPFGAINDNLNRSIETRTGKWGAAIAMTADDPLTGVGMDAYGDHFHAQRSQQVATESGLRRTVDDPHDVPLAMFSGGGIGLGLSYLAIVVGIGIALVRALRREEGDDRVLIAAIGGAWLAYQVQSLVSIDVPPIAVLPWVLGGVLVARGLDPQVHVVELPGAPPLPEATGKKGRKRRPVPLVRSNPALLAGIGAISLLGVVLATWPLRAELAAGHARDRAAAGDAEAADSYERAGRTASWEGQYPAMQASALASGGDLEGALAAIEVALEREPRDLAHTINRARLLTDLDRTDEAAASYDRALVLDPRTPDVLVEVARFELQHGDRTRAVELLERAVEQRPDEEEWRALLEQARSA